MSLLFWFSLSLSRSFVFAESVGAAFATHQHHQLLFTWLCQHVRQLKREKRVRCFILKLND